MRNNFDGWLFLRAEPVFFAAQTNKLLKRGSLVWPTGNIADQMIRMLTFQSGVPLHTTASVVLQH